MSLLPKGPLYTIFHSKCARCNVGDLYVDKNPYHFANLSKMHKTCSCCGQKFEPETGFYYGAMYVSYGVSIILMFIPAGLLYLFFNAGFAVLLSTIVVIYATMFPLIFRWSRNIWLSIFVHYDADLRKKLLQEQAA